MKKINCFLLCCFLLTAMISKPLLSQVLETEKSIKLSKDAKKGVLGSFNYDDSNKQYTFVFARDLKKETVYETMKFDYDFNQISDNS